jgi:hypothetical protein
MSSRKRQREVTEKDLMEALARAPSDPAPDSCLSVESLRLLANGRMEDEAERLKALRHFATCRHCTSALAELRRESPVHRVEPTRQPVGRLIVVFALAAMLLIAAIVWIVQRPSGNSNDLVIADLRDDVTRGVDAPPVRVSRHTKHIKIMLPLGSAAGRYDVEVLGMNGRTIVHSSGLGSLSSGTIELLVDCDFRPVVPGHYILAIRHGNSQWEFHPIVVE